MKIGAPNEIAPGERRVAMTPESARAIAKLGHACLIEAGAGERAGFSDAAYEDAGVRVVADADALWSEADVIVKVNKPAEAESARLTAGKTLIAFVGPSEDNAAMAAAAEADATIVAMEMVPRISRAQKMDALSSMANIAGYRAVIEAGQHFGRFFTGQVTAAGKVPPAKVLVVGAGVAGLAAIGTATSLGAIVYAFDVRPEVAEQIESMGAEFVYLDFADSSGGQDGAETGGYAAPSSPEFREAQLAKFRALAPEMDIVITTALIPNRPAPVLWTEDMVRAMKPGSVIVDLAAPNGGNCELTERGEVVEAHGVTIVGYTDYASRMATQASTLYANNIRHMLTDLTPGKDGVIVHDMEDDVIRGATVAHGGAITWPPPPPKTKAIAAKPKAKAPVENAEARREREAGEFRAATRQQFTVLGVGAAVVLLIGLVAPASFMQHFIVFVLACFVGFQVIWGVSHALHTPLMAVTNAISGIVILGALLQVGSGGWLVGVLAALSILIASVNVVGGFLVTRRMLAMFEKS